MEEHDFGWALKKLRYGHKVARESWNGKGMFLILVGATMGAELREGSPYHRALNKTNVTIMPHIDMYTAQGTMQPGWLASQSDMLASDWEIVE